MEDYILFILIGIVIAVIYIVNKISNGIIGEKKNVLKLKKSWTFKGKHNYKKNKL